MEKLNLHTGSLLPFPTLDAGSALREDRLGALGLLRGQAGPGQGAGGARPVEGHSSRLRGRKARRTQERGDPRRRGGHSLG